MFEKDTEMWKSQRRIAEALEKQNQLLERLIDMLAQKKEE